MPADIDITADIQPMTAFRNRSAEFVEHLRTSKRPMILTVNGRAAVVVQDAESYQKLLGLAADASAEEGIRQGLEDEAHNRTCVAQDVFNALRTEYGIPR